MIIRKAQTSDVSKLYALEKELFSIDNYALSRASFAYHVRNNLLYIAEVDGKIIGYALALIKRKKAKLYSIGVSKAHRGEKIAEKLWEVIYEDLISRGFSCFLLEVRIYNEVAISLYKKIGFDVVKLLKGFYRDGCDAYLMELEYGETL